MIDKFSAKLGLTPEMVREGRRADREDRELVDLLRKLVVSMEWIAYVGYLNKLIEEKGALLLSPSLGVDQMVVLEGEKGEMRGLIKARDLPSVIMAQVPAPTADEDEETES